MLILTYFDTYFATTITLSSIISLLQNSHFPIDVVN